MTPRDRKGSRGQPAVSPALYRRAHERLHRCLQAFGLLRLRQAQHEGVLSPRPEPLTPSLSRGEGRGRHTSLAIALFLAVFTTGVAGAEGVKERRAERAFEAIPGHRSAQAAAAAEAVRRDFDIPRQPLSSALIVFGRQSGLQLAVDSDLVAGLQAQAVRGSYTPEQALRQLLAGTGITYRIAVDGSVTLKRLARQEQDGGPTRLEAVSVTASRFERPVSELPASITILEKEDLDRQPGFQRDPVGGLAKTTPGVQLNSPVGGSVRIRGREASLRINNIEINQRFRPTGNAIFDLPPSAFQRVEVVRGADATFGFGASGGAVNFQTPQPVPGEMRLETSFELLAQPVDLEDSASPGLRQSVTGSLGSLDYWMEAGGRVTRTLFDPDGDPLPDSDNTFSNSDTIDFNSTAILNIDDGQRVTLTNFFIHTNQDPEFTTLDDGDPDSEQKSTAVRFDDPGSVFDDSFRRQYVGTLAYENDDVFGSRVNLTGFYQDRVLRQIPEDIPGGRVAQSREDNSRIGGRLNVETPIPFLDQSWFAGSALIWGGDVQRFDYEAEETIEPALPGLLLLPEATDDSVAGFGQLRVPFLEDFIFTGGLRYESTRLDLASAELLIGGAFEGGTIDFDQILFNAGVVYTPVDSIDLYFSFSQAADNLDVSRAPRSDQINSVDDIRPEASTTDQYELGLRGTWEELQITLAGFYSESDLGNQFEVAPGSSLAVPVRRPQRIYGAEATIDVQPTEQWALGGSFSFSDGDTELEDGRTVDLSAETIQPPKIVGYIEYGPFSWWRSRIQVTHQFRGDASPELNKSSVQPITFVDLYSQLTVGPGLLQIGVENLLNETEFNPAAQLNRTSTLGTDLNVPFPGTTLFLKYAIKW